MITVKFNIIYISSAHKRKESLFTVDRLYSGTEYATKNVCCSRLHELATMVALGSYRNRQPVGASNIFFTDVMIQLVLNEESRLLAIQYEMLF